MPKVFSIFLAIFLLAGCEEDKEDPATTYRIINNSSRTEYQDPYLDGSIYEVVVYHYIGDDVSDEDYIDQIGPEGGQSESFEVDRRVEKLRVSFKMLSEESSLYEYADRYYINSYKFITHGTENIITLDDNTMVIKGKKSTATGLDDAANILQKK